MLRWRGSWSVVIPPGRARRKSLRSGLAAVLGSPERAIPMNVLLRRVSAGLAPAGPQLTSYQYFNDNWKQLSARLDRVVATTSRYRTCSCFVATTVSAERLVTLPRPRQCGQTVWPDSVAGTGASSRSPGMSDPREDLGIPLVRPTGRPC